MVTVEGLRNPPSQRDWGQILRNAPPEEARRLRQHALECLHATNAQDQDAWGRRVAIAEEILADRGIRWA